MEIIRGQAAEPKKFGNMWTKKILEAAMETPGEWVAAKLADLKSRCANKVNVANAVYSRASDIGVKASVSIDDTTLHVRINPPAEK